MKNFDYKNLTKEMFARAGRVYGEPLPDNAWEYLEFELNAIEQQDIGFVFESLKAAMKKNDLKASDVCCRGLFEYSIVGFLLGLTDLDPVKEGLNPWFLYSRNGRRGISVSYNIPSEKNSSFLHDIIELTEGENVYIKSYSEGIESGDRDTCRAKLIILNQSDVDILRRLFKETGVNPAEIDPNDPKLISLFHSAEALGISPEELHGFPLGTAGLESFDTELSVNVIREIGVSSFHDAARISAILHGASTYAHAARLLLDAGAANAEDLIATRDDIMDILVKYGIDPELAFDIAEDVRRGKVAHGRSVIWQEHQPELADKVPELYLHAIEGIKYCFPRGHVIEYALQAMRMAYFKVYYPENFYTAWLEEKPDPSIELEIMQRTQTEGSFISDKYEWLKEQAEIRKLVELEKRTRLK